MYSKVSHFPAQIEHFESVRICVGLHRREVVDRFCPTIDIDLRESWKAKKDASECFHFVVDRPVIAEVFSLTGIDLHDVQHFPWIRDALSQAEVRRQQRNKDARNTSSTRKFRCCAFVHRIVV